MESQKMKNDIKEAFDSLARLAGGKIENKKIIKKSEDKVKKTQINHDPEKFYCITVRDGAFLIKSNEKMSITGNCHAIASAYLFKKLLSESDIDKNALKETILNAAELIKQHEFLIVDKIFEKGPIDGITDVQMKHFVESRINLCLKELGYNKLYDVKYSPIDEWFYDGINGFQYADFFTGISNSYSRKWDETKFTW